MVSEQELKEAERFEKEGVVVLADEPLAVPKEKRVEELVGGGCASRGGLQREKGGEDLIHALLVLHGPTQAEALENVLQCCLVLRGAVLLNIRTSPPYVRLEHVLLYA